MNFNLLSKAYRESKKTSLKNFMYSYLFINYLKDKTKHPKVKSLAKKLINKKNPIAFFYLSELYFLYGEYDKSLTNIEKFLTKYPNHPDAIYVLVKILIIKNESSKAWKSLESLLLVSKRLKTWLIMANLVNTQDDFERMRNSLTAMYTEQPSLEQNCVVQEYLSKAALRAKSYKDAKEIWSTIIHKTDTKNLTFKHKSKFTVKNAEIALKDIDNVLKEINVQMFLVSGTFLGCIREQSLLSHDHDVDVGIWDNTSKDTLIKAIQKSGFFYIQASRSPHVIRLTHINGVPIDIFFHYKEGNAIWHGGIKAKWYNSSFELVPYTFLNSTFLGPKDSNRYLSENYGDWEIPKTDFDNVLDTPNAKVINDDEMIIHLYTLLLKKYALTNKEKIIKKLNEYGETQNEK